MKVSEMHRMRVNAALAKKQLKKRLPLTKEIERKREEIMREILGNTPMIIEQQLRIANLTVSDESKNNDVVLKATSSLMDRVFGKPKESIDLNATVNFSLRTLSQKVDEEGDEYDEDDLLYVEAIDVSA